MNLLLFISIVILSIIITRIGAVAFELTGLNKSVSNFQALSCFTGTGFTTRESELIAKHPQRRQIALTLMILGHAGLVTLIATFGNTLRPRVKEFKNEFLNMIFSPSVMPWLNFLLIIILVFAVYKFFSHKKVAHQLRKYLRTQMVKKNIIKSVHLEEMTLLTEGYGVSQLEIFHSNPLIDKTLAETELRSRDITVLAIERGNTIIPNPSARTKILKGDQLFCFGRLENIKEMITGV
ncbi:hypothetical protein KDK77_06615 [bacterium]|nr:hypothetical protein [bacterium]